MQKKAKEKKNAVLGGASLSKGMKTWIRPAHNSRVSAREQQAIHKSPPGSSSNPSEARSPDGSDTNAKPIFGTNDFEWFMAYLDDMRALYLAQHESMVKVIRLCDQLGQELECWIDDIREDAADNAGREGGGDVPAT